LRTVIRNTTFADRLLFLLLIFLSVAGILISREAMPRGSDVIVEVSGKKAYVFTLDKDRIFSVPGPCGETVVEIKDRKVRVKEAHCPNRICEKQGWVDNGVIVCLPNHIVISVGGRAGISTKGVDAITG
jgi:hypothetical protein